MFIYALSIICTGVLGWWASEPVSQWASETVRKLCFNLIWIKTFAENKCIEKAISSGTWNGSLAHHFRNIFPIRKYESSPYSSWATHARALERHWIVVEEAVVVVVVLICHDVAAIDTLRLRTSAHLRMVAVSKGEEREQWMLLSPGAWITYKCQLDCIYRAAA